VVCYSIAPPGLVVAGDREGPSSGLFSREGLKPRLGDGGGGGEKGQLAPVFLLPVCSPPYLCME